MVGDFRASLYDLFGYLLPGLVMTAGLGVIWWTAFGDSPVMSIDFFATGIGSVSCLLLAYLVGHVAQLGQFGVGGEIGGREARERGDVELVHPAGRRDHLPRAVDQMCGQRVRALQEVVEHRAPAEVRYTAP